MSSMDKFWIFLGKLSIALFIIVIVYFLATKYCCKVVTIEFYKQLGL